MRPQHVLALERQVRAELTLQRLLALSRRAASARMSVLRLRRMRAVAPPDIAATLPPQPNAA